MQGCSALGTTDPNNPIVIELGSKLLLTVAGANGFFVLDNATGGNRYIKVRFLGVQNITVLNTGLTNKSFRFRDTDDLIHNYVDIELPAGSAAVNVANRTWAGHTFKSVTLI